jgi:hypothetical protein
MNDSGKARIGLPFGRATGQTSQRTSRAGPVEYLASREVRNDERKKGEK